MMDEQNEWFNNTPWLSLKFKDGLTERKVPWEEGAGVSKLTCFFYRVPMMWYIYRCPEIRMSHEATTTALKWNQFRPEKMHTIQFKWSNMIYVRKMISGS